MFFDTMFYYADLDINIGKFECFENPTYRDFTVNVPFIGLYQYIVHKKIQISLRSEQISKVWSVPDHHTEGSNCRAVFLSESLQ